MQLLIAIGGCRLVYMEGRTTSLNGRLSENVALIAYFIADQIRSFKTANLYVYLPDISTAYTENVYIYQR